MPVVYKSGKWSNEEIKLITQLVEEGSSYDDIGERTGRKPETIKHMVENKLFMNLPDEVKHSRMAENDIKNSPVWAELEKQLNSEEQDMFMHHWCEIVTQFDNNITHTERLQIVDVVRNEILINRVMKKIQTITANNESYNRDHDSQFALDESERDTKRMIELQRRIGDANIAIGELNKEYKTLMERKQNIIRDIKGTREQRIRRVEDSKETITGWVSSLMADPALREKLGKYMEKFRLAQSVEYQKLSEYYKYIDGSVEQPILNSDNIKEDNI